jgi:pimeloyl-ACP methyl ester carboxylesterase
VIVQFLLTLAIGIPLGIHFGPVDTFSLLATILTGIMVAIYIVFNVSCILYYLRFQRPEFNWFLHLVVPVVGILAFLPVWFTALGIGKSVLKFVSPLSYPDSEVGLIIGVWFLIGLAVLIYLYARYAAASMIRWVKDCDELLAAEPDEVRRVIREHEEAGFTACPEYQAAILGFYRAHVCRLSPWPAGLERSFAEAGYSVYNTMNGPSEFTVTGTLKTWDISGRLGEITAPTLLVGGRYDECRPSHLEEMHRRIPGSQLEIIEDASHLCFAEQPDEFTALVNAFLASVESP